MGHGFLEKAILIRKAGGLLAVAAAGGYPLTPLVVGKKRGGNNEDGKNTEDDFHGIFRIA